MGVHRPSRGTPPGDADEAAGPRTPVQADPFLTVAIPTFNRAAALDRTLAVVVPQLDASARLVILDNASTDDTPAVCARHASAGRVAVVRHSVNIGANANIVRCCEHAGPGHLWILPDDDLPDARAVATIRSVIARHPEADYLNFHTTLLDWFGVRRERERSAAAAAEFADALDSFGNLLFLTAGVYRADFVRSWIVEGHDAIGTCGPTIAMVLRAVGRGEARVVFSPASIAAWGAPATWDPARVTRAVYDLIPLLPAGPARRRFAAKLFADFPPRLWRKSDARGLVAALAAGREGMAAAVDRYRVAAGFLPRYLLPLSVARLLHFIVPTGAPAVARWILRTHARMRGTLPPGAAAGARSGSTASPGK